MRQEHAIEKLEALQGSRWEQPFGDGRSSRRICDDLIARLHGGGVGTHDVASYHVPVAHSYAEDGLDPKSARGAKPRLKVTKSL